MQGTVSKGSAPALNLFMDQGKRVSINRIWIRQSEELLGGKEGKSAWRYQGRLPGREGIQALKDRWESTKQRWGHALEGGEAHATRCRGNTAGPSCWGVWWARWQAGIRG